MKQCLFSRTYIERETLYNVKKNNEIFEKIKNFPKFENRSIFESSFGMYFSVAIFEFIKLFLKDDQEILDKD